MADDHHRRAPSLEFVNGAGQRSLTGLVQIGVGLVEDDEARVAVDRPGETYTLALPAGKLGPGVADLRVVALGEAEDHVVGMGELRGIDDSLVIALSHAGDVVTDRTREQFDVLGEVADEAPELVGVPVC